MRLRRFARLSDATLAPPEKIGSRICGVKLQLVCPLSKSADRSLLALP
jgi:hypothetical protein